MPDPSAILKEAIQNAKATMLVERLERAISQREAKSVPDNWPGWVTVSINGAGTYAMSQDKFSMLKEGYRNWNYIVITLIMDHITGLTHYLYDGEEDNPVDNSPFLDFIQRPNPNLSEREFTELTTLHYELTGEFYWHILRNGRGLPLGLEIMRPDCMFPKLAGRVLDGWIYKESGNVAGIPIPKEDIIHKLRPHPFALLQGYSPISANCHTLQMDNDIRVHEQAFFQNGARPDYIVNPEGELSDPQRKEFTEQLIEHHGGPANAHRPMVMGGTKVNVLPLNLSNKDQQFKDLAQWVKENVFLSKGIPLAIVEPSSNRAAAYQADKTFNKWAIMPRLRILEEALTAVAKLFKPEYFVKYENIIPRDAEFDLQKTTAYLQNKVYTINEVRGWEGLEPVDWGEEPYSAAPAAFPAAQAAPLPVGRKDAPAPPDEGYERRTKAWHAYNAKANKKETLLRSAINKAFDWDRKTIKARINGSKAVKDASGLFPPAGEWRKAWEKYLEGPGSEIFADFAQSGISDLAPDLVFDFENPQIRAQFDKLLNKGIADLTATSKEKLSAALGDAIAEGQSSGDLAHIVDETIDGWKAGKSRAYTIARTETGKISNAGLNAGWEQIETDLGRQVVKEWIATRDEVTRDTHAEADGQTVMRDEEFIIGDSHMAYPGDTSAPPEEVINCRCTMAADLAEE